MYQITNGIIHADNPNTRTRGSHDFKYYVEHTDNDVFKKSYFPRTVREWNSLPSDVVTSGCLKI